PLYKLTKKKKKQVVHGLSIPLGKLGILIPRTLSNAVSTDRNSDEPAPFHIRSFTEQSLPGILRNRHSNTASGTTTPRSAATGSTGANLLPRPLYRIGGSVIRSKSGCQQQQQPPPKPTPGDESDATEQEVTRPVQVARPPQRMQSMDRPGNAPSSSLADDDSSFSGSNPAAVLSPRHTEGQELVLGPRTIRFAGGPAKNYGATTESPRDE
ncbi:hypothetical protein DIS24_g11694, partial [Lasiodiplodia hormozganensis]